MNKIRNTPHCSGKFFIDADTMKRCGPIVVWVVDDDITEHLLVTRTFTRLSIPHDLHLFPSASAAISALQDSTTFPTLILCDVHMPVMDGFDFLKWVRASPFRNIPVALFSNSNFQRDIDRAYELGSNAYHVKSATLEDLEGCLNTILRFWGETAFSPSPPVAVAK